MRVMDAGRLLFPISCREAESFARRNLVTVHSRLRRLGTLFRDPAVRGTVRAWEGATLSADDQLPASLRQMDADAFAHDRWLLLRDYAGRARGRSVLFFFSRDDPAPSMIVKIRRAGADGTSLRCEEKVLSCLEQTLPRELRRVVPRVLGFVEEGEREVLALSGLPGQPLDLAMQRALRPRQAHRASFWSAGRWIGTLHGITRSGGGRTSIVHGDFWPRNILVSEPGDVSGVIDWEHGSLAGDPRDDLFTLPLEYVMNAPAWSDRQLIERFIDGFVRDTAVSRIVAHYFDEYCSAAGVKRSSIPRALGAYISRSSAETTGNRPQWKERYPWQQMQSQLAQAKRSALSG